MGADATRRDLVEVLRRRAGLRSAEEARRLLEGLLQALAHVLPVEECDALCACLPEDAVWCLHCGPATPDPLIDSDIFLGWVMSSMETTGGPDRTLGGEDPLGAMTAGEARARVGAGLEVLWERLDPEHRAAVGACLPAGVGVPLSGREGRRS